ncbi:MAG: transporter associated domain-containing protein [Dehalococcoidia bacterium]
MFAEDDHPHYHARGGLTMLPLGQEPKTGDLFERGHHRFEIVDMDTNRVDRFLRNHQCARGIGAK